MVMAFPLPKPPPINTPRFSLKCLHVQSDQLHKSTSCFPVCPQICKYNFNLYVDPQRVIVRCFATVRSLETGDMQDHVSPNASTSQSFQRSKTLGEHSSTPFHSMSNFETDLQELFGKVKALILEGNRKDASDLLRANYEAVKEQLDAGARGIEEAALLDVISLGYLAVGNIKLVMSLLEMLREVVISLRNEEPLLDSILVHMGSMYSTLGKFEQSMLMYNRALEILERNYGKDSTFLVTPLLGMAKVLGSAGKATNAIEHYHRAVTILESSRGSESGDLVVPLIALGNLLIKEGRAADAENPFRRILGIYTTLYGENDGRTGMAMCSLAHAKCAEGKVDEAIHLYRTALKVIEDSKYMALEDDFMEKIRIDLAELLHIAGRREESRELLEECLVITEEYKGKDHSSSVAHLINLATSYSHTKNFVEAERLLRKSLKIMMKSVGSDDQSISFPMLHLAVTLYHLKRDDEAECLALEVLRIRQKAFGKESLPVGEALDCLVSIQVRSGRDNSQLLELLQRVLRIQEKEFGYESEEVIPTLKKIVFYLDKMGRKDEKSSMQRRLSMLRNKYRQMVQY